MSGALRNVAAGTARGLGHLPCAITKENAA